MTCPSSELGLSPKRRPSLRGFAIQARVNLERMREDGDVRPAAGTLRSVPPARRTRRARRHLRLRRLLGQSQLRFADRQGDHPRIRAATSSDAVRRARRALDEFELERRRTPTCAFLRNIFAPPRVRRRRRPHPLDRRPDRRTRRDPRSTAPVSRRRAGSRGRVDKVANQVTKDPLAALDFFRQGADAASLDVNRGLEEDRVRPFGHALRKSSARPARRRSARRSRARLSRSSSAKATRSSPARTQSS